MNNWTKINIGIYETTDQRFQIFHHENSSWLLLQKDSEGDWEWCQSFGTLRDAKASADHI